MEINFLKINGFGKIKNKEINLNKKINLIYGKNEAGKTTLLKFIPSMLYGISKNKNGKEISDFDKYKPWDENEFSGKIIYTLDNKDKFEVFRDFSKKNPKIYNENLEDISGEFSINKTKGNQFFYEQTNIDEETLFSTAIAEQQGVALPQSSQNILTQKIANMLSTGDDNISYKKVMANLSKKQLEEVGTERTTERPINNILKEIKILEDEKNRIENCEYDSKSKKEEINSLEKENDKIKTEVKIYEEIKKIKEEEKIEEEKIKIKNEIKIDCENKINKLKNEIKNKKEINNKKIKNNKNILNIILMGTLIILNILINIIKFSKIIDYTVIIVTVAYLIINLIIFILNKNKLNKKEKINNLEKIKIEKEIEILEENIKNTEKEIKEIKNNIEEKNKIKIKEIKNKFNNEIEIDNLFNDNLKEINYNIDYLEKQLNLNLIRINTINIEEKNINEKLDNKIACEEKLEYLYEQKKELEELNKIINLAKETLEESYDEIKKNITPKFTKELSNNIEMISDGKYKKANFNSDTGLTIEAENGEYIECNKLSIGTIDQLYLSLRLSATKEITKETIPIILDESFAYFDNQRLENVIKYLDSNYNNQIIIFTCTNREKEILDKLNIEYNLVNL